MKRLAVKRQGDIKYPIRWTTLGEYLDWLTKKGITPNVASFIGATTVAGSRARREGRRSDARAARPHARARARGDEGRRARRRLVDDLRARELRRDARTDRDHQRGGQMRRHVHQPHAFRGEPAARSHRRTDHDQQASPARPPKSITSSRPARRTGASSTRPSSMSRRRARNGPAHHRRHVHLHRRRDRASTRPCRPGCSRAGSRHGSSG